MGLTVFLIVVFLYLGSILSKIFFFVINKYDFYFLFKANLQGSLKKYLLVPFIDIDFLRKIIRERKLEKIKYSKLVKLSLLSEVLGGVVLGLFSFSIMNLISAYSISNSFIYLTIVFIFIIVLLYLAIYDLVTFSIPENIIKKLCFFAVLVNLIVGVLRLISVNFGLTFFSGIPLGNLDNLFAGLIFALLIWLVVKIAKEKMMGEEDVYLVLTIGLILGWPTTLISFLATLIIGSLTSIVVSIYFKRFKDLIVPFVPFILLGFVVALSFGSQIYTKIFF